jgi:hypothetical protein
MRELPLREPNKASVTRPMQRQTRTDWFSRVDNPVLRIDPAKALTAVSHGVSALLEAQRAEALRQSVASAFALPFSAAESLNSPGAQELARPSLVLGLPAEPLTSRVVNGVEVQTDREGKMPFPWYAQLRRHVRAGGVTTSSLLCGASIIHAWPADVRERRPAGFWLISAAHCINESGVAVNIYVGGQLPYRPVRCDPHFVVDGGHGGGSLNSDGWFEVPPSNVTVFSHPLYDPTNNHFDVALLRCSLPDGIQLPDTLYGNYGNGSASVARLPSRSQLPASAAVIGFGATSAGAGPNHSLQYGSVRIEDPSIRQRITAHPAYTSLLNTWASGPTNASGDAVDTCQGDSGGPLFSVEQDADPVSGVRRDVHVVLGVTSWGVSCGVPTYPGVYAKLSPFVAAPTSSAAQALPRDSPWRLGLVGMMNSLGPVPYPERAQPAPISQVPVKDGAEEEAPESRTATPQHVSAVGIGLVLLVLGLVVVAHFKKQR